MRASRFMTRSARGTKGFQPVAFEYSIRIIDFRDLVGLLVTVCALQAALV
jgi:hypothetical protein